MNLFARADFHTEMYMEHLRHQGVFKYPENPLVEVFHMREKIYSLLSRAPGESRGADAWMHLVVGPEKAMLIDTGFGIGNLKALTDRLTGGKPLIVANTHFHGDHTLGNSWYDHVYCHEYDAEMIRKPISEDMRRRFLPVPGGKKLYYTEEDLPPVRTYEVTALTDGFTFDLGEGYIIELIHLPGHAPGGCGFIDRQERILFSGDAILSTPIIITGPKPEGPYAKYSTVSSLRDALPRLISKMDEFDVLYPGHSILEYTKAAVPAMLKACNEIIKDPENYLEAGDNGHGTPAYLLDVGATGIIYTYERIS